MAGAANNKGKQKPFSRGSAAVKADSKVVPYGKPSVMLKNLKDQAAQSQGKPRKADIITADYKHPQKQQMANLKSLGDARYGQGDQPWKSDGPARKS
jgi:hypothetical protein